MKNLVIINILLFLSILFYAVITEKEPLYQFTWYRDSEVITYVGVYCGGDGSSYCIRDPDTHQSFTISGTIKVEQIGMTKSLLEEWKGE